MILNKVRLSDVTTYKFGGNCSNFYEIDSKESLKRIDFSQINLEQLVVIGKGSNIVFSDEGYSGTIIKPNFDFIELDKITGLLKVGAATFLPDIARYSKDKSLANFEWLIGIPGSVGGAVRMNAGAYGYEFSQHIKAVNLFNFETEKFETYDKDYFNFSYRSSNNLDKKMVISVDLEIKEGNSIEIQQNISKYLQQRKLTQPPAIYNAGSVFKNPTENSAGYLIEKAGLKGHTIGGVKVSEKHANFFVADKNSKAQSLYDLVKHTKDVILENYQIELEEEIIFLGDFK